MAKKIVIGAVMVSLLSLSAAEPALAGIGSDYGAGVTRVPHLPILAGNIKVKGNGNGGPSLPPGQAKKWARGEYLPRDLVWTPAPLAIVRKLKPAPPGHQYVVVDGQVLLIALA